MINDLKLPKQEVDESIVITVSSQWINSKDTSTIFASTTLPCFLDVWLTKQVSVSIIAFYGVLFTQI